MPRRTRRGGSNKSPSNLVIATKRVDSPGRYTMRNGGTALITEKEGEYWNGTKIVKGQGRKSWKWFEDGRTYGQEIEDDIV